FVYSYLMADERLRMPVDEAYLAALGRAVYTFARLEWRVVWCCERMAGGYINRIGTRTAGGIARDFLSLIAAIPDAEERSLYSVPGNEFTRLVVVRNEIMHGKPGT